MPLNTYAVARAAAALAANPELTIAQLMRAARCSSGIAQRAIAEVREPAVFLAQPVGPRRAAAGGAVIKRGGNGSASGQPVDDTVLQGEGHAVPDPATKRARALVRKQLKHGPRPGAQVEAAAQAAAIPTRVLLAATDALGVKTKRGEWRLPG